MRKNDKSEHIGRAEFIIKILIFSYTVVMVMGIVFNIIAFVFDNGVHLAIIWLLRGTYTFMFTIDANVFLYKSPGARRKIKTFLCCHKRIADNDNSKRQQDVVVNAHRNKVYCTAIICVES